MMWERLLVGLRGESEEAIVYICLTHTNIYFTGGVDITLQGNYSREEIEEALK